MDRLREEVKGVQLICLSSLFACVGRCSAVGAKVPLGSHCTPDVMSDLGAMRYRGCIFPLACHSYPWEKRDKGNARGARG